jgi:hypothetical protein
MPEQHRMAEVIAGPVSKVQNIKIGQPAFPVPDPDLDQKALVSYRSCEIRLPFFFCFYSQLSAETRENQHNLT